MTVQTTLTNGLAGSNAAVIDPITNIVDRASFDDAEVFLETIDALGLPEPTADQFYFGNEADFVFLDRFGIAIRIAYEESKEGADVELPRDHDLVLLPWKQIELGRCTIEILPIADLGVHRDDLDNEVAFLTDQLSKSGIDFWDVARPDNIAYLPVEKERFPQGLPIVIDRGAVKDTDGFDINAIQADFEEAGFYEGVQERLYGELKEMLLDAWPDDMTIEDAKKFNSRAFQEFCNACTTNRALPDDHEDKRLFGLKEIPDYNCRNRSTEAVTAARNYAPGISELNCA